VVRSSRLAVVTLLALGLVAFLVWKLWPVAPTPVAVVQPGRAKSAPSAPSSVADPLFSGRPALLDDARTPLSPDWAQAPPAAKFQYSRKADERGGVEPCAAPLPSAATATTPLSRGYLFVPAKQILDERGAFDLVIHLHGESPVRRELVESGQPFVLYTLTLPVGESYAPLFAGSGFLGQLIEEITQVVAKRAGSNAHVGHLTLSAWSAGFEGVRSILFQREAERVSALLLIDGFHAPRGPNGLSSHLEPFVRFARRAVQGETWFVITHSSIPTSDYTSTTESAHFLISELGGRPIPVRRDDGFGLELVDFYAAGNLNVRGYAGNDKPDHCAQLFLLRTLFSALHRHFHP
jgi:hypothetical protein